MDHEFERVESSAKETESAFVRSAELRDLSGGGFSIDLHVVRRHDPRMQETDRLAGEFFVQRQSMDADFVDKLLLRNSDTGKAIDLLACFTLPKGYEVILDKRISNRHNPEMQRAYLNEFEEHESVGIVAHELGHAEQMESLEFQYIQSHNFEKFTAETVDKVAKSFGLNELLPEKLRATLQSTEEEKKSGEKLYADAYERMKQTRKSLHEVRVGNAMTLLLAAGLSPESYDFTMREKALQLRAAKKEMSEREEAELQYDLDNDREAFLRHALAPDVFAGWQEKMWPLREQSARAILDQERGERLKKKWDQLCTTEEVRLIMKYPTRLLERDATRRALAAFERIKDEIDVDCDAPHQVTEYDIAEFTWMGNALHTQEQIAEYNEIVQIVRREGMTIRSHLQLCLLTYNATDAAMERLYANVPNRKTAEDIARELAPQQ